jgi:flagellar biosynthesis GTPase FlhF
MVASCRPIRKRASLSASCIQLEEVNSQYKFNRLPAKQVFHLSEADVLNGKKKKKKERKKKEEDERRRRKKKKKKKKEEEERKKERREKEEEREKKKASSFFLKEEAEEVENALSYFSYQHNSLFSPCNNHSFPLAITTRFPLQ